MKYKKYIYDRFDFSNSYKKDLIYFFKNITNVEIGGNKIFDGSRQHVMQSPYELTDFIFELKKYEKKNKITFKSFLDVGFSAGINNTILNKFFKFENIVGIDLFGSNISGNVFLSNVQFKNLTLLCNNTNDKKTISKAKLLGPYDLIFIDADHSYEGVKKDFYNYLPLLKKNGVIGFHDVDNPEWMGINKFWNELKKTGKYKMKIFLKKGYPIQYGIGMLFLK